MNLTNQIKEARENQGTWIQSYGREHGLTRYVLIREHRMYIVEGKFAHWTLYRSEKDYNHPEKYWDQRALTYQDIQERVERLEADYS